MVTKTDPEAMRVAKACIKVGKVFKKMVALNQLGLPAMYVWEGDDSPEAYDFLSVMMEKCDDAGGRVLRLESYNTTQLTGRDAGLSAGKFMYVDA